MIKNKMTNNQYNMVLKNIIGHFLAALLTGLLISCSDDSSNISAETETITKLKSLPLISEKRNWSQIQSARVIRALKLEWETEDSLPRSGSTSSYHMDLLLQFAEKHKLTVQWVEATDFNQMFEYLRSHKADVIPRHLTITTKRQKDMAFTKPLMLGHEFLISASKPPADIKNKAITVSLPPNTAYAETIKKHFPQWHIETLPKLFNSESLADQIAQGKIKYSVLDSKAINTLTHYRNDIAPAFQLPGKTELAWAIAKDNSSLKQQLNEFISAYHIVQAGEIDRTHDLDIIKQKNKTLRVITRNSPETYFLWRGELAGFEYELMKEFAKRQKLRLAIVVANSYEEMLSFLEQGKGDVIAAGLTLTETRKKSAYNFSNRYNTVSEQVISHADASKINSLNDLKDKQLSVRKSSAYWQTAKMLEKKYGAKLQAANENTSTELLIDAVAKKEIDLTIADSNLIAIEKRYRDNIRTPITLNEDIPYAYVVRKNNEILLAALNQYIGKIYRGTFYNVVKNRYFSNTKHQDRYRKHRITKDSNLSPYDDLVREQTKNYNFDWRLIVSQMFQESRFNPNAKSHAGAVGLMQLLPNTANEMGFKDLENPKQSIQAGIQYLNWTRERFIDSVPIQEQIFFALAAYNAGYGHVQDAQRLAKKINLQPDRWFDHVEKALLLLQKPQYHKKSRFGYCRGSEPVNYVRSIQQRYLSYLSIMQQ